MQGLLDARHIYQACPEPLAGRRFPHLEAATHSRPPVKRVKLAGAWDNVTSMLVGTPRKLLHDIVGPVCDILCLRLCAARLEGAFAACGCFARMLQVPHCLQESRSSSHAMLGWVNAAAVAMPLPRRPLHARLKLRTCLCNVRAVQRQLANAWCVSGAGRSFQRLPVPQPPAIKPSARVQAGTGGRAPELCNNGVPSGLQATADAVLPSGSGPSRQSSPV